MMLMRKQIDEMINLANLRKEKDYLHLDIQEMELRITQLKKYLGVSFNHECVLCSRSTINSPGQRGARRSEGSGVDV